MRISDWSSDVCSSELAAIRDWVKLAVTRARNSGMPAVFWLDPYRPHEHELIQKVVKYEEYDIKGLKIEIMSQVRAMRYTLERVVRGQDTISVTRSEEHTSELQSLMRISYPVFCLNKTIISLSYIRPTHYTLY